MHFAVRALGTLVSIACLAFFALALRRSWHAVAAVPWSVAMFASALLALLLYLTTYALAARVWQCVLRVLGERLPYASTARIVLVSQFAKYAPGNVGQHLGRVLLAQRLGLQPRVVLASLIVETATLLLAACFCALAALDLVPLLIERYGPRAIGAASIPVAVAVALLAAALGVPRLRRRAFSALERAVGLLTPDKLRRLPEVVLLHCLNFVLGALALRVLIAAMPGQDATQFVPLLGLYAVSWLCGFGVPGAPAGLGIREAVLLFGLAPLLSSERALVVTLGLRLVTTVGDGLAALIGVSLGCGRNPVSAAGGNDTIETPPAQRRDAHDGWGAARTPPPTMLPSPQNVAAGLVPASRRPNGK